MSPAGDTGLLLTGPGAPLVAEFCLAEFAMAVGTRSTGRGSRDPVHARKAAEDAEKAADGRHVRFHHDQVSFHGTTRIEGGPDLADPAEECHSVTTSRSPKS